MLSSSSSSSSSSHRNDGIDAAVEATSAPPGEVEGEGEGEDSGPVIQIRIQNIVATTNFGCPVDLDKIAQTARNAEYNPRRFQGVILRIRDPKTTALIFSSGKMIVTGAKTERDSKNAAIKYTAIINKVGFPTVFSNFTIQNITGTCDCGFPIRLEGLIYAHSSNATYEPELFPGLVYRMTDPKVVLLIFVSGKIVLTGAKNFADLSSAFEKIFPLLLDFRKSNLIVKDRKNM